MSRGKGENFLNQLDFLQYVHSKGYNIECKMYSVYVDILMTFTKYEYICEFLKKTLTNEAETENQIDRTLVKPIILPSIANAIFIAMYGDFEGYVNQICNSYKEEKGFILEAKDLRGEGIQRAVNYLEKIVGLNNIKNSTEWNEIMRWNSIRNILVHNNGVIKNQKDDDALRFLNLNFNHKKGKVYLQLEDCQRFQSLVIKFFRLCI